MLTVAEAEKPQLQAQGKKKGGYFVATFTSDIEKTKTIPKGALKARVEEAVDRLLRGEIRAVYVSVSESLEEGSR